MAGDKTEATGKPVHLRIGPLNHPRHHGVEGDHFFQHLVVHQLEGKIIVVLGGGLSPGDGATTELAKNILHGGEHTRPQLSAVLAEAAHGIKKVGLFPLGMGLVGDIEQLLVKLLEQLVEALVDELMHQGLEPTEQPPAPPPLASHACAVMVIPARHQQSSPVAGVAPWALTRCSLIH